jgi:2-keto-4-pentenoate hydratase/2-oxohepta-3-ene-1,7-dioic acid hydratase in catechol pathway
VKLCRFELKSNPGEVRSGLVYSGKIYETDGEQSIAVHEADQIRPLSPVGRAPSLRVFRLKGGTLPTSGADGTPLYFHLNPTSLYGPSQSIPRPDAVAHLDFETYLVGIVGSDGIGITPDMGDSYILGFTLGIVLVSREAEREEETLNISIGRSFDIGGAIGPVITTPDDLEESLVEELPSRKYGLSVVTRVNGVEVGRGHTAELPFAMGNLVAAASELGPVRSGDLLAIGPIANPIEVSFLESGDDVQVSVENLGTLSLKIA